MKNITRHSMIGSPERVKIQRSSYQKLGRFITMFGSYRPKTLKTCQYWPKNGQILVLNGQNSAISEFSRHIENDFLKEDHKNNFHTKT